MRTEMTHRDTAPFAPDLTYANPKVVAVRKIRTVLLAIELIVLLVVVVLQYTSGMEPYKDLPKRPLLPFEAVMFGLLAMALVITISSIAFQAIEINVTETGSQKFLLAHNSQKGSITTAVLAFVFAAILFVIPTMDFTKDLLNSDDKSRVPFGSERYEWSPQDELLIADLDSVTFTIQNNVNVHAAIYRKTDLEENKTIPVPDTDSTQLYNDPAGVQQYTVSQDSTIAYFNRPDNYGAYTLLVENNQTTDAEIHYIVHRQIRPSLLSMLIWMCLLFGIIEVVWAVVCVGIKSKHKSESIYK